MFVRNITFFGPKSSFSNFYYQAYAIFEHIFEHIEGPLSGLFFITNNCKSEEIRGGAFSIRHDHGVHTLFKY